MGPLPRRNAGTSEGGILNIGVAGGGAAGFMAAVTAAEAGAGRLRIAVFDGGTPLGKLLLTGGGRCNLANATFGYRELAANFPRGEKFLYSVFSRFGARDTMDWFESRGLALRVEDGGRVFPRSQSAADVRDLLLGEARRLGVTIHERSRVRGVERGEDGFRLLVGSRRVSCRRLVLATGGDYRGTVHTGYELAAGLGHTVTPLRPSLTGLVIRERWPRDLAGVTVGDAGAAILFRGRESGSERGGFVFTHRGISGPLAFRVSSLSARLDYSAKEPLRLVVNLAPGMNEDDLEREIISRLREQPGRSLANALGGLAPRGLLRGLLASAGLDAGKPGGQVTREERRVSARLITGMVLTVVSPEPEGEVVTAGGVVLDEVMPATMESRIVPGLYLAGEILDIDGFTGGFNLQAAWSTGRLAGLGATRQA